MNSLLLFVDLKSLIVFTILNFLVNGGFLFLVFRVRRQVLLKWQAYGCLSFSAGWFLYLLRFIYGINLVTLPLANIFILLMPMALTYSVAKLLKIRLPERYFWVITITLSATFIVLSRTMQHPWIPGIYTSILNGVFYFYSGFLLFKYSTPRNATTWTIWSLTLLTSFFLLTRSIVLTVGWLYPDSLDETLMNGLLTTTLLFNIMGVNAQVLCFPILNFMESQRDLLIANQKLEELSNKDDLTGLLNRRRLKEILNVEFAKYVQYGIPFSVVLCDLDHFKGINDCYGHLAGDIVLEKVAKLLTSMVRPKDFVMRFGGEEFILLLLEADRVEAFQIAERLRQKISEMSFNAPALARPLKVTASFGVADITQNEQSINDLLKRADLALYEAKGEGRNRVCMV
jgi:diguanylate cyclase (GGDEF)-like protein